MIEYFLTGNNIAANMCDKNKRRSALSFNANGSLDIDDVLQSDPWKHIAMFDDTEAACIQNILHDFNSEFTQEKALKPSKNKIYPLLFKRRKLFHFTVNHFSLV